MGPILKELFTKSGTWEGRFDFLSQGFCKFFIFCQVGIHLLLILQVKTDGSIYICQ